MGNFAVYHCEKGNTSSGGIGNHIDRKEEAKHTYKHADPNKKDLNQSFSLNRYCSMPLHQAIQERIKEGYKSPKAIRKDAVKYTTHILTGSHEKMKEIEKNPEQLKNWVIENKKFLEQEFGKDNIVRFVIHRDEKTPHLHAVTVNLTSDGRLSAKEIIGNKKDMQNRQDRYAQAMESFGLERGLKNTGIKHEDASEYYKRMNHYLKVEKIKDFNIDKTILGLKWATFGVDKDKTIENLQKAVKSQITAIKSKDFEIEKIKSEKEIINDKKDYYLDEISSLKYKLNNSNKLYERILINDSERDEMIKERLDEILEKSEFNIRYSYQNEINALSIVNSTLKDFPLMRVKYIQDLEKLVNKHQGAEKWKEVFVDKINEKNNEIRYRKISDFVNYYENKYDKAKNVITYYEWNSMIYKGLEILDITEDYSKKIPSEEATDKTAETILKEYINQHLGHNYFEKNLDEKSLQRNKELNEIERLREIQEKERNNNRSWRRSW